MFPLSFSITPGCLCFIIYRFVSLLLCKQSHKLYIKYGYLRLYEMINEGQCTNENQSLHLAFYGGINRTLSISFEFKLLTWIWTASDHWKLFKFGRHLSLALAHPSTPSKPWHEFEWIRSKAQIDGLWFDCFAISPIQHFRNGTNSFTMHFRYQK